MKYINNWINQEKGEDFYSGMKDTIEVFYANEYDSNLEDIECSYRGMSIIPSWESELEEQFNNCLLGKSEPDFKLFSIDPGLGKTTAAARFLKKYKDDAFCLGGSVLILVSRINEVQTYLDASGLDEGDYAVLVSDHPIMHKGRGYKHASRARILFTTQQMFASRLRGGHFADIEDFHYMGKLRSLRIWDETLEPAKALTVGLDVLDGLATSLRSVVPDFIEIVEGWVRSIRTLGVGSALSVPGGLRVEIETAFGRGIKARLRQFEIAALDALGSLAGREVELFATKKGGLVLVGCGTRVPDDLAPLIILDASGSVRGTYDLWERHGSGLTRMPPMRSDYQNLWVCVHKIGSGKAAMRDAAQRAMTKKIAIDLVNADRDEWLLIHHKEDGTTIADEIRDVVSAPARIKSIHWGDHHGTNEYRHIKKVLVLGLMTYPPSAYRGMHMGSAGLGVTGIDEHECRDLVRTELMHHLLQGISRCNVRNHAGGTCGDATVHMVAAAMHDPLELVRETFPGARVREWVPLARELRGKANDVVVEVRRALDASGGKPVSKKAVRDAVGIDQPALAKLLRREDVKAHLEADGVRIEHDQFRREAD